jgi:hypothetical protein
LPGFRALDEAAHKHIARMPAGARASAGDDFIRRVHVEFARSLSLEEQLQFDPDLARRETVVERLVAIMLGRVPWPQTSPGGQVLAQVTQSGDAPQTGAQTNGGASGVPPAASTWRRLGLYHREGRSKPDGRFVPRDGNAPHANSGVTIAAGFDLGGRNGLQ